VALILILFAISSAVKCRSFSIRALISSSLISDGRPERGASSRLKLPERKRANHFRHTDSLTALFPYTLHISRSASAAFNPFRKKKSKICRKCTLFASMLKRKYYQYNTFNSSAFVVKCQRMLHLFKTIMKLAAIATRCALLSR